MDTATSHIDDIRHDVSNRAEERRANASSEYKRNREENHIEIVTFETRGFGCGLKKIKKRKKERERTMKKASEMPFSPRNRT